MVADIEQRIRVAQGEYLDFLDDEEGDGLYYGLVKEMISEGTKRLIVNINDLRKKNVIRARALTCEASQEVLAFNRALKELATALYPDYGKKHEDFFVGFEGCFGDRHLTPRSLTSKFIDNLICVEGIVTKVSLIRPKIVQSVHYCSATKKVLEKNYSDILSLEVVPTSSAYPTKDDDGNLLETEFGLSLYKDHQVVTVQEMPENSPAGQLPRSVDVVCNNDLVDLCKPGDRIQVVASYKCVPSKNGGYTSGAFHTTLIANNISQLDKEKNLSITREEVSFCKKLAKDHNIFDTLSRSLAPSIHGHDFVKKAILCLLLGGVEKNLMNGTRLRGDINVLLIGDPSVAKSQLLRYVLHTAPRAIPTTGRGSSGVGLTAAVTTDQETGERRLEAGAMVLADRGVVCIDEFDKMSDIDRTAIHEVMEQGRVTISKAGVHATLNARCSVLAAANPVYGRYDQYKTPMENIGLQDSLLSRFDLLFVMLDVIESEHDKIIADHVVRMHQYRNPKEQDGEASNMDAHCMNNLFSTKNTNEQKNNSHENYDVFINGKSRNKNDKILSVQFMRKYVHIAKCLRPKLTEQACEVISNEYSKLRSRESSESDIARTQPITVRTLETLIRLATAHAKARLSNTVAVQDAKNAIELLQYAYFKKVLEKEQRKRQRKESDLDDDSVSNKDAHETDSSENRDDIQLENSKRRRPNEDHSDIEDNIMGAAVDIGDLTRRGTRHKELQVVKERALSKGSSKSLSRERLAQFKAGLHNCFKNIHEQSLSLGRITEYVNRNNTNPFSRTEIETATVEMADENQIMIADGIIFLI